MSYTPDYTAADMNETCRTYDCVMHDYVARMHKVRHTYELVMSHTPDCTAAHPRL